ncbi:TolC family protein [Pseudolabrys sp. FHR47]|uniref:TolC family protein n=1 Tax=Pseudolabrys sp. FHR47 TaxID=2562284 RepID=UPI0010BEFAB6|nr:TolC family protein [Pseudolabrys sp. FHR47]
MSAPTCVRATVFRRWSTLWRHKTQLLSFSALLLLPACASFSPDGGMSVTTDIAARHLRKDVVAIRNDEDADAARVKVDDLLKRTLNADTAVQIALFNNRGLQAAYNELGIAEAQRVQQSLPPNPSISISRLSGAAEIEIERKIAANILALLTLPARAEIATERFHRAQLAAALETLRVASDARKAFYRAVAARQAVGLLEQSSEASSTTAELAKRMTASGAMNKLDQSRQQLLHTELTTELARARQRATSERERLVRALGLSGKDLAFKLPSRLPSLPNRPPAMKTVEEEALNSRVDLKIARSELDSLAKSYGLTKTTRFVNVLESGYLDKRVEERATGEHKHQSGFELTLQVPLFDFGEARAREAEQTYMQAVNRLAQKAVNARSEAREAYRNYRTSYDVAARYQRDVLPLRNMISEELMLRYGAMQIDVFALLTEARQRIAANANAVDALRDFWLASADLQAAVIGGAGAPSDSPSSTTAMAGDGEPAGH